MEISYRRTTHTEPGDAYLVLAGGKPVGTVYKAWARLGGWGWSHSGLPKRWDTRKQAAQDLIKHSMCARIGL